MDNSDRVFEIFESLPSNAINQITEATYLALLPVLSIWLNNEGSIDKKVMGFIVLYEGVKKYPSLLAKNKNQLYVIHLIRGLEKIEHFPDQYHEAITKEELYHLKVFFFLYPSSN